MGILVIRVFFVLLTAYIGFTSAPIAYKAHWLALGFGVGSLIVFLEMGMRRVSLRGLSSSVFGLILGLIMAKLVGEAFALAQLDPDTLGLVRGIVTLVFCYLGLLFGLRGREEFNLIIPYIRLKRQESSEDLALVDTSAIIDGRIMDVCKTRFLDVKLVVPRFVLRELQYIADSSDPIKRQRGRRGLEILNTIQKDTKINLIVQEEDFADIKEVDAKLVRLAKVLDAKILTVDYNLNRVAQLQGVQILNINELALALKPVVFPGELLELKLIREGKEQDQGVGYLDDGTMVVVEGARSLIGQKVRVAVTSSLQTQAGRMVFGKIENENHRSSHRR